MKFDELKQMIDWPDLLAIPFFTAISAFWVYSLLMRGVTLKVGILVAILFGVISYIFPNAGKYIAIFFFILGTILQFRRNKTKGLYAHSRFKF